MPDEEGITGHLDAAAPLLARTMIAKDFPFTKDFH